MFLGTAGLALFSAGLVGCFQKSVSSVLRTSTMTAKSDERPKLVVFDLDYTLWPQHVDTTVHPPLRKDKLGNVFDSYGQAVKPFPEVPTLLEYLRSEGYQIAAASRTDAPPVANELIKLLDWDHYFDYREIYPGCKKTHFMRFQKSSGITFTDMIFFDDEMRNIRDVSQLGVTAIYVRSEGMTRRLFDQGLAQWRKENVKS
ncbi:magnesium-dependent phosphatase 1-like [Varroa jacobsoni]|uniref:magnesium-dependent phosphatase 1-like n=1 Tax=Varroa jacobsoni TaxID=62625 RepID=UPI000BF56AA2|nr:magnesium-dependent phosphatase 1-like [Varroa jacobsoni]